MIYGDGSQLPTIDPTYWYGRNFVSPGAIDSGSIQYQVAQRLSDFFAAHNWPQIAVYQWPKYDLDCWWKSNAIAFVLVAYNGARLTRPLATSSLLQERTVEYEIFVIARQSAWATFDQPSPYYLVWAIEQALSGFQPLGCKRAYLTDERFTQSNPDDAVWMYRMRLETHTMLVKWSDTIGLADLTEIQALVSTIGASAAVYTVTAGIVTLPVNTVVSSVANPTSGALYRAGTDYLMDGLTGVLTALPGGALTADGTQIAVQLSPADLIQVAP